LKIPIFKQKQILLICFLILCNFCFSQLLEIDYAQGKKEESSFKVHVLRYGIIGGSSLQHLDITSEVLKFKYDAKKGIHLSFSIFGTRTIWSGNKKDGLNTFDIVMNPIGGTINGNLFASIPIYRTDTKNSKVGLSIGKKWVQGPVLSNFKNNTFFDNYGRLGLTYQSLLAEDPLQNTNLYFWGFPHAQFHHATAENRKIFFNNELNPFSYGYGLEIGLEYNSKFKLVLLSQQMLDVSNESNFKNLITRLILAYRF